MGLYGIHVCSLIRYYFHYKFLKVTFQRREVRQTYQELSSLLRHRGQNVQTSAT